MKPLTLYKRVLRNVKKYNPTFDEDLFKKAFYWVKDDSKKEKLKNGEPYLCHPLKMCYRLSGVKADTDTLIACLLHDSLNETNPEKERKITENFGEDILKIVKTISKLNEIKLIEDMGQKQIDSLRRLFLSLSNDIRVVLIKLAERIHQLEISDEVDTEKEKLQIGKETISLHVPLADGLGIWDFKWRLEDMSFKIINPEAFSAISAEITDSKNKMESYIRRVSLMIGKEFKQQEIQDFDIQGRVKNLYSIYKKIVMKNKNIDEIYDIIAIRIIVKDLADCYRILGIIHNLWRPLPHRIKDYIAVPKINGYRSLHTTIFCLDNHLTEIQIRTIEMHNEAEFGLAAHFSYSEKKKSDIPANNEKQWILNLKNFKPADRISAFDTNLENYEQNLQNHVFADHIFVFTPRGHVKDLPKGATPIDFAYEVHTDLGHRCIGAKINGKMATLDSKLKNGDIVDILTKNQSYGPKREWLSIVKTSKAKNKIKAFLKHENREINIKIGRDLLNEEALKHKKTLSPEDKKTILQKLPYENTDDLYAAIGEASLSPTLIIKKIWPELYLPKENKKIPEDKKTTDLKIIVEGEKNLENHIAKCCEPKPKDKIIGYVTIGKGISIHKKTCKSISIANKNRILKAWWK